MARQWWHGRGLGAVIAAALLAGCGGVPVLPESLEVATSTVDRVEVSPGSGPSGFADSTWSITRIAGGEPEPDASPPPGPYGGILSGQGLARPPIGERIFLLHFGGEGQMTQVTENRYFLAEIYGRTVPIGGEWTGTVLPGISFRSASYGTQNGERFGVAVVVNVRWGNTFLGRATLYAWGTQTGDAVTGTFGYLLDFTEGLVPTLGTIADQYPIEGERVAP